jgi:hypothetical protein
MNSRERIETALRGGKPDRVPIMPIYDIGYVYRSIGRDPREYHVIAERDATLNLEQSFLAHDVDGIFVHRGNGADWDRTRVVEKHADYWQVTDTREGETFRLRPDGYRLEADGRIKGAGGESLIRSEADIDAELDPPESEVEIEESGRYAPLRYLSTKYPHHHFSFQLGSPMVRALNACGGYVEGLTTMALDRRLYRQIMARAVDGEVARIAPGLAAGGRSAWFTSYYTGADTISPRDYAEMVFPYEREVCQAIRDQGLFVLDWFLGDLMPILDKVMELPIDALVLEPGRKGYEIDPVEIRRRVGPHFCLFGFGLEEDYCGDNRAALTAEVQRQIDGAGRDGAFIAGTPIMPPDARPEAVDHYFREVRRLGAYA